MMTTTTSQVISNSNTQANRPVDDFEIHLPSLKVVSYNGTGDGSGVPSSLEPLARRIGTRIHWLSVNSNTHADVLGRALSGTTDNTIGSTENFQSNDSFQFYTARVSQKIAEAHKRLCDTYLWPLFHGMPEIAEFDPEDWKAYKELCAMVASDSLTIAGDSFPTISWLHDYQLALAAPYIAQDRGSVVCQFWHVPWPKPENIASSPITKEVIEGLLANRLLGFHTAEYAHNFMETTQLLFPDAKLDHMEMKITIGEESTQITVMPLGIDVDKWRDLANSVRPISEALAVKHRLANQIILGVDRLDYTKGVLEKLYGLEFFLTVAPEMHRRFHYVQISQSPQSKQNAFDNYAKQVETKIKEINERFSSDGWSPIIHLSQKMNHEELAAWYQAADILSVNSIRDGLNLIAKEFVATRQDEQGVLIVSKNAGCAQELSPGALVIDPRSPQDFSDALNKAMNMPVEEKRRRMTSMRHVVSWNQLHDWALGFLKQSLK